MLKRGFVFVLLGAALAGLLFWSKHRDEPLKVSGFIEADEIRVGSRVGGRVSRVPAEEGKRVRIGDLLVELEPYDLFEQRAEAASILAQRKAELEKLTAGYRPEEIAQAQQRTKQLEAVLRKLREGPRKQEIATAAATLELAEAELERARFRYRQVESLVAKNTATADEMDQATTDLKVARANVTARTEQLNLLKEGTRAEEIEEAEARLKEAQAAERLVTNGYRAEEIAQAAAAVKSAQAALDAFDVRIAELRIAAPVNGTVEAVELQPGDLVGANAPVLSLIDSDNLWVRAYVPENRLNLQLGQKVDVSVDSFPDRRFEGTITFVARQAEFTPGNVQTPEERSKQVFRIKVSLPDPDGLLRPGMSADVWLGSNGAQGAVAARGARAGGTD